MNNTSDRPRKKRVYNPEFTWKRELFVQEVLKLYHEGTNIEEIAKKTSLSYQSVIFALKRHKSELSKYPFRQYKSIKRNENIAADYLAGMSIIEIASKYSLHFRSIHYILTNLDIKPKRVKKTPAPTINQLKKIRNRQIAEDYKRGMEIDELKIKYSLRPKHIYDLLRKTGVQLRRAKHDLFMTRLYDEEKEKRDLMVVEEYKNGTTVIQLAAKFSRKGFTIYKILWDHGIKPSDNPAPRHKVRL